MHHGTDDKIVPPAESDTLKRLLLAAGKKEGSDFEIHTYDGEGHGFQGALAVNEIPILLLVINFLSILMWRLARANGIEGAGARNWQKR